LIPLHYTRVRFGKAAEMRQVGPAVPYKEGEVNLGRRIEPCLDHADWL
jgi:hypothetical protein